MIDGRTTVVVDASASPQRESSKDITRISSTQLKNGRRQEQVYMVHLYQIGVEPDHEKGSRFLDAWECMLDEFSDVFPVDQPGLPPERSVAMEIELEEAAKPVAKP
jgi:hypothetical protein